MQRLSFEPSVYSIISQGEILVSTTAFKILFTRNNSNKNTNLPRYPRPCAHTIVYIDKFVCDEAWGSDCVVKKTQQTKHALFSVFYASSHHEHMYWHTYLFIPQHPSNVYHSTLAPLFNCLHHPQLAFRRSLLLLLWWIAVWPCGTIGCVMSQPPTTLLKLLYADRTLNKFLYREQSVVVVVKVQVSISCIVLPH